MERFRLVIYGGNGLHGNLVMISIWDATKVVVRLEGFGGPQTRRDTPHFRDHKGRRCHVSYNYGARKVIRLMPREKGVLYLVRMEMFKFRCVSQL